ncbi:MAG TPA: cohesin domain-containing protein, partial [Anaerolineales bacterium]
LRRSTAGKRVTPAAAAPGQPAGTPNPAQPGQPAPNRGPQGTPQSQATAPGRNGAAPATAGAPGAQAAAQGLVLSFNPPQITQPVGSTFAVNVDIAGAQNVYSVPLMVQYNPQMLQMVNVSNGSFLSQDGQAVAVVHRDDASTGTLQITATRPPNAPGVSGQGHVFTLTFMAKAAGEGQLAISRAGVKDSNMQAIPAAGTTASVVVK